MTAFEAILLGILIALVGITWVLIGIGIELRRLTTEIKYWRVAGGTSETQV